MARQNIDPTVCELRTKFRLGGLIGDYIGIWGGTSKGYTTNLVPGSYIPILPL